MITPNKRKKIEDLILNSMSIVDKSEINTNTYKRKFESMNDSQFDKYIKELIKNDDVNFYMQTIPFKNQPTIKDIKEGLTFLNIPTEEYVYFPHLTGDKNNPIRSKLRCPVGYLYLKRLRVKRFLRKINESLLRIKRSNNYITLTI